MLTAFEEWMAIIEGEYRVLTVLLLIFSAYACARVGWRYGKMESSLKMIVDKKTAENSADIWKMKAREWQGKHEALEKEINEMLGEVEDEEEACPECGATVLTEDKECPECGVEFD